MRILLCLLVLWGCESAPRGSYELPESVGAQGSAPATHPADPVYRPDPPDTPDLPSSEPPLPEEELAQAFSSLGQVMAAMRDASIQAAERQEDVCVGARLSMIAAAEAADRTLDAHPLPGNRRPPPWLVAPESEYLALCRSLPVALQPCGRFDYKIQHGDECNPEEGESSRILHAMAHADRR